MGTNYYWHETCANPCAHCGQSPIHVGKQSAGWSFLFRAHRHDPDDHGPSPVGFDIKSRADWRQVFTTRTGRLIDEYNKEIPDPVAWLDGLTPPDAEKRAWENSTEARGPYYRHDPDRDWRDIDGFRFYCGEFS